MHTGVGDPFTIETLKRSDGLLITTANGTANTAFAVRLRFKLLGELDPGSYNWILDIIGVDKFERDTGKPFVDILNTFKARGGKNVIVIANENHRMMLSSIGMSSVATGGPPIEIVSTMEEAMSRHTRKAGKQ